MTQQADWQVVLRGLERLRSTGKGSADDVALWVDEWGAGREGFGDDARERLELGVLTALNLTDRHSGYVAPSEQAVRDSAAALAAQGDAGAGGGRAESLGSVRAALAWMRAREFRVRRAAMLLLYQLDAHDGRASESDWVAVKSLLQEKESGRAGAQGAAKATSRRPRELGDPDDLSEAETVAALALARSAYAARGGADRLFTTLAPTWPPHRQPAVDRAILRLAHHELSAGADGARAKPRLVVNDAVELSKEFSTERSPAFVNGLLDKVLRPIFEAEKAAAEKAAAEQPGRVEDPSEPRP